MLEQAVYAGRNHSLSLAVAAALILSAPAQAADVVHVGLGSNLTALIAAPDGGAYVRIDRPQNIALGRASADGHFVSSRVDFLLDGQGGLGPDGQAWFKDGIRTFARMDAAGRVTKVGPLPQNTPVPDRVFATGPDGTLWTTTTLQQKLAHITADGTATFTPTAFPPCKETPDP